MRLAPTRWKYHRHDKKLRFPIICTGVVIVVKVLWFWWCESGQMEKVSNVFRRESYGRMNSQAHKAMSWQRGAVRSYGPTILHVVKVSVIGLKVYVGVMTITEWLTRKSRSQHWLRNRVTHDHQSFHVPHPAYRQDETRTLLVLLEISRKAYTA